MGCSRARRREACWAFTEIYKKSFFPFRGGVSRFIEKPLDINLELFGFFFNLLKFWAPGGKDSFLITCISLPTPSRRSLLYTSGAPKSLPKSSVSHHHSTRVFKKKTTPILNPLFPIKKPSPLTDQTLKISPLFKKRKNGKRKKGEGTE